MISFTPVLLLVVLLGLFSQGVLAAETTHVVIRGDTVFSISRQHGVSQDQLMVRNGMTNPSQLQVGMRLFIPSGTGSSAQVHSEHTVAPGETLFSIARNHRVTLEALREANRFSQNHVLRVGERIRIPHPGFAANTGPVPLGPTGGTVRIEHIVAPGETLFSIARNWGVTLVALRETNGFSQNHVLRVGERIRIPYPAFVAGPPPTMPPGPSNPAQSTARRADPTLRWPIPSNEIVYMGGNSRGVLILGRESESVRSISRGTVVHAGPWRGYGNVVIIESAGGFKFLYGANESLSVRAGDTVEPGTEVGKLGIHPASGRPELVFIVVRNGIPVDPATAPRS